MTPVAGTTGSYDVAFASKSKTGTVAVSTIASAAVAASTITVDVDTTVPQVTLQPHPVYVSSVPYRPLLLLLLALLLVVRFGSAAEVVCSLQHRCVPDGVDCLFCQQLQRQLSLFAQPLLSDSCQHSFDLFCCIKLLQQEMASSFSEAGVTQHTCQAGRHCCSIFAIHACVHDQMVPLDAVLGMPGMLARFQSPPLLLMCCDSHLKCILQVTITSPQLVTDHTNPTITVNYGGRVAQLNPLLLYNISGAARTDVVYDVNSGVVTITAYVDDATQNVDIW